MTTPIQSGDARVWVIEDGPGPEAIPEYYGRYKIGDPTWSFGDVTPVQQPSGTQRRKFDNIGAVQEEVERPTYDVKARYHTDLSDLLRIGRKRCPIMVQVHMGPCRHPQDYRAGFSKMLGFPDSRITQWGAENLGAIESAENAQTDENAEISAEEAWEVVPMTYGEEAADEADATVRAIIFSDNPDCGDCGDPSDGCQVVLVAIDGTPGSPAASPSILYSEDTGSIWATSLINTMTAGNTISDMDDAGDVLVVISNDEDAIEWILISEMIDGGGTWVEVTTGIVAAGSPNGIYIADPSHTFICGDGGYIYFADDPTNGVTVQDAGGTTTEDLYAIHGQGNKLVVAVGENGAVVSTTNGGETWTLATAVTGVPTCNDVYVVSELTWWVATTSGLFYTLDGGVTWTEKVLPGALTNVDAIDFVPDLGGLPTIGYLVGDDGANTGIIQRTWSGGALWYEEPRIGDLPGSLADGTAIAACEFDHNLVFAGGATAAADGVVIKGSG